MRYPNNINTGATGNCSKENVPCGQRKWNKIAIHHPTSHTFAISFISIRVVFVRLVENRLHICTAYIFQVFSLSSTVFFVLIVSDELLLHVLCDQATKDQTSNQNYGSTWISPLISFRLPSPNMPSFSVD